MSDHNIPPVEIQIEILRRLPPRSVFRFASVSKQWNSLIHSSEFVNDYTVNNLQVMHTPRLFIVEKKDYERRPRIYSFVDDDDDTFPHNDNKSIPFLPDSVNRLLNFKKVAGSSHGLLCLIGSSVKNTRTDDMAVIWNPMIRKSVSIPLPNVVRGRSSTEFGFGVCPKTCDPKIVKINPKRMLDMSALTWEDTRCTNWQVEVFTLSSGEWREIPSPPDKLLTFLWDEDEPVAVDGFIYWLVTETIDPSKRGIKTLVSFDLTSEEFKQVYRLPDKLQSSFIQIFKFRESLAIIERESSEVVYKVWILENGAFKELLNIYAIFHLSVYHQPVLRRNGQLIMRDIWSRLVVYKPDSNQTNTLEIYGDHRFSYVTSMTESLLLLNVRSDSFGACN